MTATLTSLETRVKTYLSDSTSLVFSTALVDEALRLALAQYNLVLNPQAPATINGLDGAVATTFQANAESLLVLGACGYAAQSRIVKRSESFNLAQHIEEDLLTWGKLRATEFNNGLKLLVEQTRQATLRGATVPPYPTATTTDATGWLTDSTDTTGQDV